MRRRSFLQLATSLAGSAVVQSSFAAQAAPHTLSLQQTRVSGQGDTQPHGTVVSIGGTAVISYAALRSLRVTLQHGRDHGLITGSRDVPLSPAVVPIELLWEKCAGADQLFQWIVDRQPYRACQHIPLTPAPRYRLRFMNGTTQTHPLYLQSHRFEITRMYQAPVSLPALEAIALKPYATLDMDVVNTDWGLSPYLAQS